MSSTPTGRTFRPISPWGSGNGDSHILKFTRDGKFLLQIGKHGQNKGSNDTQNVNRSAGYFHYPKTNELFVADGYGNRRVIVFDAVTSAYKRHWGAYGKTPDDTAPRTRTADGPPPQQFNTVHGITIANDGLVYVADRANNRVQVFNLNGTFVKEAFISRRTIQGPGTAFDVTLSHEPVFRCDDVEPLSTKFTTCHISDFRNG